MKQLIDDATVTLKLNGIVTDMYPNLTENQVKEVSHFVYHRINMADVHNQAMNLIKDYVDDELGVGL